MDADAILMAKSFSPSPKDQEKASHEDDNYTHSTRDSSIGSSGNNTDNIAVQSPTSVANQGECLSSLKTVSVQSKVQAEGLKTLVSWQSRKSLRLSDPRAQLDESIEAIAVDISFSAPNEEDEDEDEEGNDKSQDDITSVNLEPPADPTPNVDGSSAVGEEKKDTKKQTEWDRRYAELLEYYNDHGHSNVRSGEEYGSLRSWMERQKKAQRKNKLVQDKVIKLVAVKFDWEDYKEKTDDEDMDAASI